MNDEKIFEEVWEIARVIRNETRPVDGHTDPKAIIDCWNELEDRIKEAIRLARQDERERIVRNLFFAKKQVDVFEVAKLVKFEDDPVGLVEAGRIMEKLKKEGLIEIAGGEEVNEK